MEHHRTISKEPSSKSQFVKPVDSDVRVCILWFLLPEGDSYDGKGVGGVYWSPTVCVRYKGELANLPTPVEEALSKATAELKRLDDGTDLSDSQKKRLDALTRRIRTSWR